MDGDVLKTIAAGIFSVLVGFITARGAYAQYRDKLRADLTAELTAANTTDRENERQDLANQRKFIYELFQQEMGGLRLRLVELEKKNIEVSSENLQLRQDNIEFRDRVGDLEKENSTLRGTITEMQKQISLLQARLAGMEEDGK